MQDHEGLTQVERKLETVLAGFKPYVATVDRDHLMFEAGRASARPGHRLWQGLTSLLAVMFLVSILVRPKPVAVDAPPTLVANHVARATPLQLEPADEERLEALRQYVRTRRTVLERGIEALTTPSATRRPSAGTPPMTRESLDEFLSST